MVTGIVQPISNDSKWGGDFQLHNIGIKGFYDMRDTGVRQVANLTKGAKRENPNRNRVYDTDGIAPCVVDYSGGVIWCH